MRLAEHSSGTQLGRVDNRVQQTEISIIIPARNEEKMIGRCLAAVCDLDFPRDQFEVILLDNGSEDSTVRVARSYADRLNLKILQRLNGRISALRNLGAKEARGAILAFLDADCLPPRAWLTDVHALAHVEGMGVIGAHYLLPDNSSWVGRTWHRYQEAPKSGEVSHVPAGDLIVRHGDFLRVGGFDEGIQTNEDYELCERVRAAGMQVRAFPHIGVVHLGTAQSLRVFYRKQRWHGTDVLKVFLRDLFHSDNAKAVLFAAYSLLCVTAFLCASVWFLLNGPLSAPLAAVAGLLLPPLGLALRRVISSREWSDLFPLGTLYLIYGLARARALLSHHS